MGLSGLAKKNGVCALNYGGGMEELKFSRERMLSGFSRVMDYVGITTLCRIFEGEFKHEKNMDQKILTTDEIAERIREH